MSNLTNSLPNELKLKQKPAQTRTQLIILAIFASLVLQVLLLSPVSLASQTRQLSQTQAQPTQIAAVELDPEIRAKVKLPEIELTTIEKSKVKQSGNVKAPSIKAKRVLADVIATVLQLLAGVSILFIIINAFKLITAAGEESKLSEAKKNLGLLIGGLLIIFLSYSITSFVFKTVLIVEELEEIVTQ